MIKTEYEKENAPFNSEDIKNHFGMSFVLMNKNEQLLTFFHKKLNAMTVPIGKAKYNCSMMELKKESLKELMEELNIFPCEMFQIGEFEKSYLRILKNDKRYNVKVRNFIFYILGYKGLLKNKEEHKHTKMKFRSREALFLHTNLTDSLQEILKIWEKITLIGEERKNGKKDFSQFVSYINSLPYNKYFDIKL